MDTNTEEQLWQAITILEAREMLMQIRVNDFQHLKKEVRTREFKKLHKLAFPPADDPSGPAVSTADLAKMLALRSRNG